MASPKLSTESTLKKDKKDEGFLEKLGTLARKKKVKEGINNYKTTNLKYSKLSNVRKYCFTLGLLDWSSSRSLRFLELGQV